MQVGAASAATAAQYTGAAVMLVMMVRKGLLLPNQAGNLPPLPQWGATLRPGIPFAFCIAAVVTALLTATNLATGALRGWVFLSLDYIAFQPSHNKMCLQSPKSTSFVFVLILAS